MGPCGKTSRPPFRRVPLPLALRPRLPSWQKKDTPQPSDSTARVETLARFLCKFFTDALWTTAIVSSNLPIGISSSTVMAAAAAATAADRSRRGEEKKGKKNEDVQSERNSVPLVSKTRFSETIRHRIQERGGSEGEREQGIPEEMRGSEEERETIRPFSGRRIP